MTQHTFEGKLPDGRKYFVLAGWDRMLGQFFLDVEEVPQNENTPQEPIMLYESMYDSKAPTLSWEYFASKLRELQIVVPDGMEQALNEERSVNAGNLTTNWDTKEPVLKLVT